MTVPIQTDPRWPYRYRYMEGMGYVVWRDVFEGRPYDLKDGILAHRQATFVIEADAKDYCLYRNQATMKYGTDDVMAIRHDSVDAGRPEIIPGPKKKPSLPVRIFRWCFPDIKQVIPGSLWFAHETYYRYRLSGNDLLLVKKVHHNGTVFADLCQHEKDKLSSYPDGIPMGMTSLPYVVLSLTTMDSTLMRGHSKITEEEARELGFILPPGGRDD